MTILPSQLSQSSLQDYVDCARLFQLRYLDRLSYPAEESEPALEYERHRRAGEEFHRLIQRHLIGISPEQLEKQTDSPMLQRWWQNYSSGAGLEVARDALALYPESQLSVPMNGFRLTAKYDLIAARGDGLFTIYDWKTYRKRPRNEWLAARLQTRVYRTLLAKAGAHLNNGDAILPSNIEMIYWFADFPDEPARFSYSEGQLERDWSDLIGLAREISSASDFPLTKDLSRCRFCPYRSFCNRGVRAGSNQEFESEPWIEEINLENIGEIEY
jgi:hypothetical protein